MADEVISGANVTCAYAFEDPTAFQQEANRTKHLESNQPYNAFGREVDISISRNHNKERVYGIGGRNAVASPSKDFAGTISINGTLSSPYWFLGVLGKNTDAGTIGKYTHTYEEENCLPTLTIKKTSDFGTTQGTEILYGAIINQASLTASVNESVKFNLECPYRFESLDDTNPIDEVTDNEEIFTFAGGVIKIDNQELALVQNFEMTFNNNADLLKGIGSRYAEAVNPKNREYNFKYTIAIQDYSVLEQFHTGTAPSLSLEFTNCAGDKVVATFDEIHLNEDSLSANINDVIKEDVTGWAHTCSSVVYTNTTEIAPREASNI